MEVSIFMILVLVNFVVSQENVVPQKEDLDVGYYWRGYDKDIPDDALPGGKDKRGKKTYIGQTMHQNGCVSPVVVTGHIYEAQQHMKYEWGYRQQISNDTIQILCTRHPDQFEWIETNITAIHNLTDVHLVSGGREKNYTYYIGRMLVDDEVVVGKILVSDLDYMQGFYTTINETKLHIRNDTYEVLAYHPGPNDLLYFNSVTCNTINQIMLYLSSVVFLSIRFIIL